MLWLVIVSVGAVVVYGASMFKSPISDFHFSVIKMLTLRRLRINFEFVNGPSYVSWCGILNFPISVSNFDIETTLSNNG